MRGPAFRVGVPEENGTLTDVLAARYRWEFVFPESSDKLQRTPWQTLKDAMHLRFQV